MRHVSCYVRKCDQPRGRRQRTPLEARSDLRTTAKPRHRTGLKGRSVRRVLGDRPLDETMAEATNAKSKTAKSGSSSFEIPSFEIPKFDMPKMEVPAAFRDMAEKSISQAKDTYEK